MSYSYKKVIHTKKEVIIQKMSYSYNKNELFIYYIYKK